MKENNFSIGQVSPSAKLTPSRGCATGTTCPPLPSRNAPWALTLGGGPKVVGKAVALVHSTNRTASRHQHGLSGCIR